MDSMEVDMAAIEKSWALKSWDGREGWREGCAERRGKVEKGREERG